MLFRSHFVPDHPAIIASSQIAMPGKSVEVYFKAPMQEGDYPYVCTLPGHAFTMVGVLAVSKNPKQALDRLKKGKPRVKAQWPLLVTNKPLLQRAFVQNSPARSICVGLRSEEHTSELQSRTNLVCRLLLEKKKTLTPRI